MVHGCIGPCRPHGVRRIESTGPVGLPRGAGFSGPTGRPAREPGLSGAIGTDRPRSVVGERGADHGPPVVAERVEVRGLSLAVHRFGDPGGLPVLALHGFMDCGHSFRRMAAHLEPGLSVWAPDARGHGASDWVGAGGYYHFWDYIDDAARVLEALGIERCGLLGHSMGGTVATALAATYPERFEWLVLLEGMGPPFTEPLDGPARLRRWRQALRSHGDPGVRRRSRRPVGTLDDAADRVRRWNPRVPADHALELAQALSERWVGPTAFDPNAAGAGPSDGSETKTRDASADASPAAGHLPAAHNPSARMGDASSGAEPDRGELRVWRMDPLHRTPAIKPVIRPELESVWSQLRLPVLSLWGAESRFHPDDLAERHRRVSQVRVAHLPKAGHNLHHEQPEAVAAAVRAWAAGQGPPGPWRRV
jgi:pimeloyl-ACP methyl ester carboxylesterase